MPAIEHRFVAGLAPESSLWTPTRSHTGKPKWSKVHLCQSDLDSACGLHVLLMALTILLGLSRSEVLKLTMAERGPLAALWEEARHQYFGGTDGRDLLSYVEALDAGLHAERHGGTAARITRAVTSAVLASHVPLLRVIGRDYDHWVLVTGVERATSDRADASAHALLVLDPGERAPQLSAYTGRIDLAPRVHRRTASQIESRSFAYRSIGGDCVNARLVELLVLRLAQAP